MQSKVNILAHVLVYRTCSSIYTLIQSFSNVEHYTLQYPVQPHHAQPPLPIPVMPTQPHPVQPHHAPVQEAPAAAAAAHAQQQVSPAVSHPTPSMSSQPRPPPPPQVPPPQVPPPVAAMQAMQSAARPPPPQSLAPPETGQADYSAQWAEYFRSVGMIKAAEAIETAKVGAKSGVLTLANLCTCANFLGLSLDIIHCGHNDKFVDII